MNRPDMGNHVSKSQRLQAYLIPMWLLEFLQTEAGGGFVLIVFAGLALVLANSAASQWYFAFINTPVSFSWRDTTATAPLKDWVKDGPMALFFLSIGLELKREFCVGFLAKRGQILLPLFAALFGMIMPALIYALINIQSPDTLIGFAIPSATDIAFVLAMLAMVAPNLPAAAKIFLLAVAIFDDLGAIILIGVLFHHGMALLPLGLGFLCVLLLLSFNRARVVSLAPYLVTGLGLWFCCYFGGLHTTLAGVAVGLAVPITNITNTKTPLDDFIHELHPLVSFIVLPLFAFTSAGVDLRGLTFSQLFAPIPLGIALGLLIGKPLGIFGVSWLLIKTKFCTLPQDTDWLSLFGVALLAGIGFTMSLFIGTLAFHDSVTQDLVKTGVIAGSLLAIIFGLAMLSLANHTNRKTQNFT